MHGPIFLDRMQKKDIDVPSASSSRVEHGRHPDEQDRHLQAAFTSSPSRTEGMARACCLLLPIM